MKETTAVLEEVGISHPEARMISKELIKKGYLGAISDAFAQFTKKGRGIQDFLDTQSGKVADQEILTLIHRELPDVFGKPNDLRGFLEAYDIDIPSDFGDLYKQAESIGRGMTLSSFKSGIGVTYEGLTTFKKPDGTYPDGETIMAFLQHSNRSERELFIKQELTNRMDGKDILSMIHGDEKVIGMLLGQELSITLSVIKEILSSKKTLLTQRSKELIKEQIMILRQKGIYSQNLAESMLAQLDGSIQ